jgi:hypothetical protein
VDDLNDIEWRKLYEDAVAETDQEALLARVRAAKAAVVSRLKMIQITSETRAEASALEGALRNLIVLAYERSKARKSVKLTAQAGEASSQND